MEETEGKFWVEEVREEDGEIGMWADGFWPAGALDMTGRYGIDGT
jgi:hypothetical protein